MSLNNKYILNYFNKNGKAELCRLIFAAANVEYQDNFIENLTDSDTMVAFMPYLQVNDIKLPLISVICRYLAREFNLAGEDSLQQAQTDAIAQTVMLLIDTYYREVYSVEDIDQKNISHNDFLANDAISAADMVENMISLYSTNGNFCVGDSLTYADLFVYEMITNYFPADSEFMDNAHAMYPKLCKIKSNIQAQSFLAKHTSLSAQQEAREVEI